MRGVIDRRRFLAGVGGAAGLAATISVAGLRPGRAWAASESIVETSYGKVRGFRDNGVDIFRGVRYGGPTGGANRFKPPLKPTPWSGVADALHYGDSAPQRKPRVSQGGGIDLSAAESILSSDGGWEIPGESEDCLFLNVWTSSPDRGARRPVMVWLHGGGFVSGSGSAGMNDGANLVRRGDVVVVTLNHRLNGFGYNHFGDIGGPEYALSGNAGMLDIVLALEWIRDNIERFGGDPKRVMIFGESGGGQKVSMLLGCPLAKGLFSRAVIESGAGPKMLERARATEIAEIYLKELGLDAKRLSEIHNLPAEALVAAYFGTAAKIGGITAGLVESFSPVLDPVVLPRHPFSPTATGISADVPVMLGWNRTEMSFFAISDPSVFAVDEAGMRARLTKMHGSAAEGLIETYRAKYPSLTPADLFILIWSDYPTMTFSNLIAERRAALGQAPTYLYRFDWATPVMDGKLKSPHTLEIPFVFDTTTRIKRLTGGGEDAARLAASVSSAWIAFAANGDPNTEKSGWPAWAPYDAASRSTMIIDTESRLVSDPAREERLAFAPIAKDY